MAKVRTRFAPSPTGYMHIGNLRTALYEYLIAKHDHGDFILRIEDTDQEREVEGAVDMIYKVMDQTGLGYDEGPNKPGEVGPYVQSERLAIYKEYADKLVELGGAHYCFCDEETINKAKEESDNEELGYIDPCKHLSLEEAKQRIANGEKYVVRQTIPSTGITSFEDEVYGHIEVENAGLAEGVLLKSDGYPTYNFANIVDDHLMNITHVVRGNEYLSSSPKYNRLYEAFGWKIPVYVHCPLITDEEHKKLSKRCGHSSFEDLLEQGFLPECIVNFVALLGWSPADNQEKMTMQEMIEKFDYTKMSKSPAVFDYGKLKWLNGEYIKEMDDDRYMEMALPHIKKVVTRDCDYEKIAKMVKTRIEVFPDIEALVDFFQEVPEYDSEMYVHKKMKTTKESSLQLLKEVLPVLEAQEDFSNDALFASLSAFAKEKGYKTGFVMWPIRTAVSGKQSTPGGATELMEILGKEESIARIKAAIEKLSE